MNHNNQPYTTHVLAHDDVEIKGRLSDVAAHRRLIQKSWRINSGRGQWQQNN